MAGRDDDHHHHLEAERRADGPEEEGGGHDEEEQSRRAAQQERHRFDARRFFDAAPPYRVRFEEDGTVSLCAKRYEYWPNRAPSAATRWRTISNHPDLEQAERRLRHVTSPPVYYDERGRLAQTPATPGADVIAPRSDPLF